MEVKEGKREFDVALAKGVLFFLPIQRITKRKNNFRQSYLNSNKII